MLKRYLILIMLIVPMSYALASTQTPPIINSKEILRNAPSMDPEALNYAIRGYRWALSKHDIQKTGVLTLINFHKPSYEKRLWVINLKTSKVLFNTYTTQGKGSGLVYAKSFSNNFNTNKTSLGVYKAVESYHGKHGLSLRVQGLEKGINSNAYKRSVVMHPAYYASKHFVKSNHRAGRSWGCFAIDPSISRLLVNTIKDGSIIFAYATPEQHDQNLV